MPKCTVIEQGMSYVMMTDERGKILKRTEVPYPVAAFETDHRLPAKDAKALEKIARLAKEGKSPGEIASIIRADHPEVADETLDAYYALREERVVGEVKKFIR